MKTLFQYLPGRKQYLCCILFVQCSLCVQQHGSKRPEANTMTPDLMMIYHVKETLSTNFLCFWFTDLRERKYLCNILQVCVCVFVCVCVCVCVFVCFLFFLGGGVQWSGTEVQVCNSFYILLLDMEFLQIRDDIFQVYHEHIFSFFQ